MARLAEPEPVYSPDHAPDRLVVELLRRAGDPPRSPTGEPTPEQWRALWREHADRIWREAYNAGAVAGICLSGRPNAVSARSSMASLLTLEQRAQLAMKLLDAKINTAVAEAPPLPERVAARLAVLIQQVGMPVTIAEAERDTQAARAGESA